MPKSFGRCIDVGIACNQNHGINASYFTKYPKLDPFLRHDFSEKTVDTASIWDDIDELRAQLYWDRVSALSRTSIYSYI